MLLDELDNTTHNHDLENGFTDLLSKIKTHILAR